MAQQRYHVIERIDAGGMAEVFKANSTSLQGFEKLVAIKRILPKLAKNERFVRMFLDEAKLSLHLSHTNCVQVFDLGLADNTYFIVMEFVDGVNLKHIIEESRSQKRPFPVEQAVYVGLEVCKGLAHAHEKTDQEGRHLAIVHRDISPPNILISREGEVKITDFGLAKAKSQVETTDPGVVKGKFGYLSPEAAHGGDVDSRTDIFAVGILVWEMLTGQRLFLGETDLDTLQQVRRNSVPSLAKYRNDVPHQLEKIIRRALATEIEARYQSVKDLGRDLAAFLFANGKPVTAFDLANWVQAVREKRPQVQRTQRDKAVEDAVQEAVNRIVTLEEVDDLDRFMAEQYHSLPDQGADLSLDGSGGEDPRMWAEMGFGEMELTLKEQSGADEWEERGLTELIRRQTAAGVEAAPKKKSEKPPPPVPDDRTIQISDMEGRLRADAMRRASQMNLEAHVPSFRDEDELVEHEDRTRPDLLVGQQPQFGKQNIQPVSDSVSQAMASVQQATRNPGSYSTPPEEQETPYAGPMPTRPPEPDKSPFPMIIIAVVVVLMLIAVGVIFGGVL